MEEIIKLLLVEDDANLCYIIQGGLEDMIGGYKVLTHPMARKDWPFGRHSSRMSS